MQISSMGRSIAASETLAINAKIQELRAKGRDVISFAAGEPDFETPAHIKQAALAALEAGHTRYTAASGIIELRSAVAQQRSADHGCPTQPGQVVVTAGAKQALALAFQVILEPGDEVLIPKPYWVSFPQQVLMCRAKPVFVETSVEDGFVPTREAVEARIHGPHTRAGTEFPLQSDGRRVRRDDSDGVDATRGGAGSLGHLGRDV